MTYQRSLPIFFAGVLLMLVSPTSSAAPGFGQLAERQGKKLVWKTLGDTTSKMEEPQPVVEAMRADTGKKSGAKFTIGSTEGAVLMGPESRFTFHGVQFQGGFLQHLDLWIEWGIFRFSFAPPPTNASKEPEVEATHREVQIKTGPDTFIQLYGTDVYVRVERDGGATTVYVAEGVAVVAGSGQELRVEEGQWAYVPPGGPPRPWNPGREPDDRPATHFPEDWQPPGPPWLDLIRLDLPQ